MLSPFAVRVLAIVVLAILGLVAATVIIMFFRAITKPRKPGDSRPIK